MKGRRFWIVIALALAGVAGFTLSMLQHRDQVDHTGIALAQRIQTFHYPDSFSKQIKGNPKAGEIVYQAYCSHCHASDPQIPVPAPRINQRKVWLGLSSLGEERLVKNTLNGLGAMPARGGCFECDDASIRLAVRYLLERATGEKQRD